MDRIRYRQLHHVMNCWNYVELLVSLLVLCYSCIENKIIMKSYVQIYSTLVQKCLPHDETNIILSYLEKAIPCLSRSEGTQVMARKIWTSVVG